MQRLSCVGLFLLLVGCGGGGSGPGGACTSSADCTGGMLCRDGRCAESPDTGPPDSGPRDTGRVDTGPTCAFVDRCGGFCCPDGEECVDTTCLPFCASALRCGPASTCCPDGDLCIGDSCVTPGAECSEALDCEDGSYCDPGLGRCLPRGEERCEFFPPPGVFEPEEQWSWTLSDADPGAYKHVMMTPVVGDISGDGVPEVVFGTYNGTTSYGGVGVLRAVRGDTGEEVLTITSPVTCPEAGIALGDLDGDGVPEIVTTGPCTGPVLAFRNDGTLFWSSTNADGSAYNANLRFGAISIADLDSDGKAEVIVAGAVIEYDGVVRWSDRVVSASNCCGDSVTAVYDIDGDGQLEIVGANIVWEADGTKLWDNPALPDGYVAAADFFGDDAPDIVVVHSGSVSIRAGIDGTVLWGPVALPGGGRGGPPTVADFDGDGEPEIGVAGSLSYSVFDPDGDTDVLWSQTTQDSSSNITGSSVFDFDGDGTAEVVYNDECFMRVYSGPDGTVLAQVPQHSHTLIEYPLIVDVDNDGNAEIVFAGNALANRCSAIAGYTGNQSGIRVFRDASDNWVGTRPVWNQHTYHITNIREDLTVPRSVLPNWRRFNSFRKNPQSFDAPDLVADDLDANVAACPPNATLSVVVRNRGAVSVGPGLPVSFYLGIPDAGTLIATERTVGPIVPGGSVTVSTSYSPTAEQLGVEVPWFARVDDVGDGTGEHNECLEDNNLAETTFRCGLIE